MEKDNKLVESVGEQQSPSGSPVSQSPLKEFGKIIQGIVHDDFFAKIKKLNPEQPKEISSKDKV